MELWGDVCGLAVHPRSCSATSDARIRNTKIVVPAQAGTQTPQRFGFITDGGVVFYDNQRQGFWVPAFAGTTLRVFV